MKISNGDIKKLHKKLGYKGCKNCIRYYPAKLCEWTTEHPAKELHLICPGWINREAYGGPAGGGKTMIAEYEMGLFYDTEEG